MQDQLFDFLVGKDIRRSAIALAAEEYYQVGFHDQSLQPAQIARSESEP
jgi:hypothetical protein